MAPYSDATNNRDSTLLMFDASAKFWDAAASTNSSAGGHVVSRFGRRKVNYEEFFRLSEDGN